MREQLTPKSAVYGEVNRKWKSACRIILGGEVGELEEFREWLSDYNGPRRVEKSIKSGKPVVSYDGRYSKGARWVSLDEVDFSAKPAPLDINRIKDIDSIIQGISEQVVYAGNINLGNSTGIEGSTTVMDSHFIYHSESAWESKYAAYTSHFIGECIFGGHCASGNFLIRCNTFMSDRSFEIAKCDHCSEIYYSHGLSACHDCMFSFNLRAKRNCIGNLQLSKEKYAKLKQKLIWEMREKLRAKHKLPHIIDIFKGEKPDYAPMRNAVSKWQRPAPPTADKNAIENAFTKTCELVFGVPYKGIGHYAPWLKRNTRRFEECNSCATGMPLLNPDYADFLRFPRDRLLSLDDAEEAAKSLALDEGEAEKLGISNAGRSLSRIAYFSPEWKTGNNANNIECPIEIDCTDCYRCIINIGSKRCAYGWWPRNSEHLFGFNRIKQSAFSVNAYDSEKIQRCFEVSEARGCSDCYYCHNIENCQDCLFCFNAKNLKCAVGNVQLPREKYLEVKKRVLVVDDNGDILSGSCLFFEGMGAKVSSALMGGTAIKHASVTQFNVVILDQNLFCELGTDVGRQLRGMYKDSNPNAIFISYSADVRKVLEVPDAKAIFNDFAPKPEMDSLASRVFEAILKQGGPGSG